MSDSVLGECNEGVNSETEESVTPGQMTGRRPCFTPEVKLEKVNRCFRDQRIRYVESFPLGKKEWAR